MGTRQNKYYKRSRISEAKFRQLVRLFAQDLPASEVAVLTGLQRKTVNSIFFKIRVCIAQECERQSPLTLGEVEVDESYFGPRRVRGKRRAPFGWGGAANKTPVFGLLMFGLLMFGLLMFGLLMFGLLMFGLLMFGLLKRQGKVYTEIVPDCRKATLQAIIRGRVAPDAVVSPWNR